MEKYITGTKQKISVHNKEDCWGQYCVIHNPSNHNMRNWPTHWRDDRQLMERICKCGIGHPDPDDLSFKESLGIDIETEAIHGCCGCCTKENK